MINIEFGNVVCKLNNLEDIDIHYEIADKLSYMIGGFGIPKELRVLYNIKTHCSYTGLIPHIINILKKHNLKVELVDRRNKPNTNANFKLVEYLDKEKTIKFSPRDYQQKILDNAQSRMIVQMATGAGKTCVLAGMIAKFNVKPVIVMSPKATLAFQLREEISKFLGEKVGILTGTEQDIQDITISTPQTALKSDLLKEAKALLVDECQFLGSHTLFSVCREAKNAYYRCAVSATPWRDGNDDILIEAAINIRNPKSNINASTLIKKGKLTPCEINFVKQEQTCEWLGSYGKTYDEAIVNNTSRNNKIINLVKTSLKKDLGSTLVLINKIEHGNILLNRIKKEVINKPFNYEYKGKTYTLNSVEFISGETSMEERSVILQATREQKVKVLIGSTIADEGLDCPALKVLILAGAGKSSTRAFQRVGRVLRLFKDRTQAYVYDFMDMMPTFYMHYLYRKALYSTEPEWTKNMKEIEMI